MTSEVTSVDLVDGRATQKTENRKNHVYLGAELYEIGGFVDEVGLAEDRPISTTQLANPYDVDNCKL